MKKSTKSVFHASGTLMNLLMKHIVLYCMLFVLVTSCVYAPIRRLSDDDEAWAEPYEKGDTVLFTSSLGVDTFIVDRASVRHYGLPFKNWNIGGDLEEFVFIQGRITHGRKHFDCSLGATRKKEKMLDFYIRFCDRFTNEMDGRKIKFNQIVFKGDTLKDVLYVNGYNSQFVNSGRFCTADCAYLVWSKSRGLLQYKYNTGEIYVFHKKCPLESKK